MIKIVIAFDDRNQSLGDYFLNCLTDIISFFEDHDDIIREAPLLVSTPRCNQAYFDIEIPKINPSPFVFIGYSHGNETGLRCEGGSYIRRGINTRLFNKSLFYTNACLSGKELGQELIENGCFAFIGYREEVFTFANEYYNSISIRCENSGLKTFFSDNIPISVAFKRMQNYFTNKIDKYESIDPMFAAQLVQHREALIIHSKTDIYKEDLFC